MIKFKFECARLILIIKLKFECALKLKNKTKQN